MAVRARYQNHPVIHKLVVKDGAYLELPPWSGLTGADKANLSHPDVYQAASSVQEYPIETVFRDGGRTFVYGRWDTTLNSVKNAGYGVCTTARYKDLSNSGISGSDGDTSIVINYATTCAAHAYAGGYLGMKGSAYRSYRIIDNDAQDASNYVTFYLDGELQAEVASSDDFVLMENPYAAMDWYTVLDTEPYIGVTVTTMVASYYAWIQTWGPHLMCSGFNTFEGADGCQFGVFLYHGSFQALPSNASAAVTADGVPGGAFQAGVFACGTNPSSPADVSIAYPVYLTIRP